MGDDEDDVLGADDVDVEGAAEGNVAAAAAAAAACCWEDFVAAAASLSSLR